MCLYTLVQPDGKTSTHETTGNRIKGLVDVLFMSLNVGDVVKTMKQLTSGIKMTQTITYEKVVDEFGVVEVVSSLSNKINKP